MLKENYYRSFHWDAFHVRGVWQIGVFKIQILKDALLNNETYLYYLDRREANFACSSSFPMPTSMIGYPHLVQLLRNTQTDRWSVKIQPTSHARIHIMNVRQSVYLANKNTFCRKG